MFIDNDAKMRVNLTRLQDGSGNDYYIGKLQFSGTLELEKGETFMVFVAEKDVEELQIGPLDETRRSGRTRAPNSRVQAHDKLIIDMHPFTDAGGNIAYVGEAKCPGTIDCRKGLFFHFFNSKEGREELQIGRLMHKPREMPGYKESAIDDDNDDRLENTG